MKPLVTRGFFMSKEFDKEFEFVSQLNFGDIIWCGKREKYLVVINDKGSYLDKRCCDVMECETLNEALNFDILDRVAINYSERLDTDLCIYYSHFMAFDTLVLCPHKNHYAILNEL